ncbi:hypothetical protein [Coralloluteibacterium stylophorae]|nr:hypothetical protein [Coralloluteibacterium stylophorae]
MAPEPTRFDPASRRRSVRLTVAVVAAIAALIYIVFILQGLLV